MRAWSASGIGRDHLVAPERLWDGSRAVLGAWPTSTASRGPCRRRRWPATTQVAALRDRRRADPGPRAAPHQLRLRRHPLRGRGGRHLSRPAAGSLVPAAGHAAAIRTWRSPSRAWTGYWPWSRSPRGWPSPTTACSRGARGELLRLARAQLARWVDTVARSVIAQTGAALRRPRRGIAARLQRIDPALSHRDQLPRGHPGARTATSRGRPCGVWSQYVEAKERG